MVSRMGFRYHAPGRQSYPTGGRRPLAMAGLYFEEFTVGQLFRHQPGRTVTEADNVLFTTMTMNPQPLHLDAAFASSDGIRAAAGQQPVDAGNCRGAVGGGYDAGDDGGQSGLRQDRIPEAGVPRRYAVRRDGNHGQAGIAVAPGRRGGVFRAPRHQPARGTGGTHSPGGVDAQKAGVRNGRWKQFNPRPRRAPAAWPRGRCRCALVNMLVA